MSDYPDTNGNGVPDVFENRLPISEILNRELPTASDGSLIIEIERQIRAPRMGELYFLGDQIKLSEYDHKTFKTIIIKRVISGVPVLIGELE